MTSRACLQIDALVSVCRTDVHLIWPIASSGRQMFNSLLFRPVATLPKGDQIDGVRGHASTGGT